MEIKAKYIWMNGKFVDYAKAQVHVLNHSLHYGSAVFDGMRCYSTQNGPAIFRLKDHVDRLFHSAEVISIKVPFTKKQVLAATLELIKKNKLEECYIRHIIYFGEKMGLSPLGAPVNLTIAVWSWGKYFKKESLSVKISSFMRIHPATSKMTAKISGHYINSILASQEAGKAGFDEALLLDWQGNIAEGPGENVFFVKNKKIYTPEIGTILPGITRGSVIDIARDMGYEIIEKKIKLKDIKQFQEAFFVGTAVEINAIGKIDDFKFGDGGEGMVSKEIRENFAKIIHGKNAKYKKWLTSVT